MRHITIKNRYEFDTDTNHGGSTELDEGKVLDGEVEDMLGLEQVG